MNALRAVFKRQAGACADLDSPFMARLMGLFAARLAPGTAVADRILGWEGDPSPLGDSVPLRIAGGLHALRRAGYPGLLAVYPPQEADDDMLWAAVMRAFESESAHLLAWLDQPPQTNEVRRAAALIPALHLAAARFGMPVRLTEIGTSAGLNLRADAFHLEAGGESYGPADAPVRLAPDWSGPTPRRAPVEVVARTGIDIAPIDPEREGARLLAYLWPDQPDRIARTSAAIALARRIPAEIVAQDAADWLAGPGLAPVPGALHLLFHTIAWQYLPADARARGDALIAEAGARATEEAPLARFAMEAGTGGAALSLQLWPDGRRIDLGLADYHGRWVRWSDDGGQIR
ncbi:DUF2332 domain-containing protein [Ovoidimarina sediminis]|uniref:DUF2332 domain-containing protein n=1 Tax=Ovoidimarina sediminis TaxID=3079856 RepID=UPI0029097302|nr:DUF2332 family protein [Rhodophyticola sp. MJ-SS7]MDU8942832.1 DUF2332 family protein [Rhodophyticola sp. MJ-SS7]